MTVQITLEMLEEIDACEGQKDLFADHFPNGVEFKGQEHAIEMCVKFAEVFDFEWAADGLLEADTCTEFKKATAPALAEFKKAITPAQAEYDKVIARQAEYDKVIASAFAKAFFGQETSK